MGSNTYNVPKDIIDCYWFLKNLCRKGESCEYRHSEEALLNTTVCPNWMKNKCTNKNCKDRHPSGPHLLLQQNTAPCYYFQQGMCSKGLSCPFSHDIPETDDLAKKKEELRKLQEQRRLEETRLAQLRSQAESILNQKRKADNQPSKEPVAKKEKSSQPVHVQIRKVLQQTRQNQQQFQQKQGGKPDKLVPLAARTLAELKKEQGVEQKNQKNFQFEKQRNQKGKLSQPQKGGKKKDNFGFKYVKKNDKKSSSDENIDDWRVKTLEELQREKNGTDATEQKQDATENEPTQISVSQTKTKQPETKQSQSPTQNKPTIPTQVEPVFEQSNTSTIENATINEEEEEELDIL